MKIIILTFNRALNYGAVLQAWALQEKLSKLGHSVIVLDYLNPMTENIYKNFKIQKEGNLVKETMKACVFYPFRSLRRRRFMEFNKHWMNLSPEVPPCELPRWTDAADCYIAGSDQIWNDFLTGFDPAYFLDFVVKDSKKYSYAVSLGMEELPGHLKQEYQNYLNRFRRVSVREESAKRLLQEIVDQEISVCVDPTLLLDQESWSRMISSVNMKNRYIVVYSLNPVFLLMDRVMELAEQEDLDILYICNQLHNRFDYFFCTRIKHILTPAPQDFLSLIAHATYVATNSFHGTVFSIIFHKLFMTEIEYGSYRNNRIENLLKICGLQERIITKSNSWQERIDWEIVDEKLASARSLSEKYLNEIDKAIP